MPAPSLRNVQLRADKRAVDEHLAVDLAEAQRLLMAGVLRGPHGQAVKAGDATTPGWLRLHKPDWKDVGKGAAKGRTAFSEFSSAIDGQTCLDIGASTGGFTQLLLEMGAAKVYAVDVGKGLLAQSLRHDTRVEVYENHNFRHGPPESARCQIGFACADLSFCSLLHMVPSLQQALRPGGQALLLVKPQFELSASQVPEGGVVRRSEDRLQAVVTIWQGYAKAGFDVFGLWPAGKKGRKGNQEYFVCVTLR